MSAPFLIIAAVMVVVALALVLVPMLRSAHREGHPRAPFWLALALALAMPPVVFGAYLGLGTPQALRPVQAVGPGDLANAVKQLRASLDKKPNDARGWALLSQAYSALNQPRKAADAVKHVLRLNPNDANAMVELVEATAEANPRHHIDDAGRTLLQRALAINPTHQRALWLLGISDFQRQHYQGAIKQWTTLLPLLPQSSKVAAAVQQELAQAQARVREGANPTDAPAAATPATGGVAIRVKVNIEDLMLTKLKPGDTLYVFARAINGPAMPLAVAKLSHVQFPATVTLTDAMAVSPSSRLSQYRKVKVVARISGSGNALPQAGDLQSTPLEVATDTRKPVTVTIDRVD